MQAYIAAMPEWKRDIGGRLDALVVATVPDVKKCVRWNSPFYGVEGQGWFLSYHVFARYVRVTFFKGSSLHPLPPMVGKGKDQDSRWVDIHADDLDAGQMAHWIAQAAGLPGWDLR